MIYEDLVVRLSVLNVNKFFLLCLSGDSALYICEVYSHRNHCVCTDPNSVKHSRVIVLIVGSRSKKKTSQNHTNLLCLWKKTYCACARYTIDYCYSSHKNYLGYCYIVVVTKIALTVAIVVTKITLIDYSLNCKYGCDYWTVPIKIGFTY